MISPLAGPIIVPPLPSHVIRSPSLYGDFLFVCAALASPASCPLSGDANLAFGFFSLMDLILSRNAMAPSCFGLGSAAAAFSAGFSPPPPPPISPIFCPSNFPPMPALIVPSFRSIITGTPFVPAPFGWTVIQSNSCWPGEDFTFLAAYCSMLIPIASAMNRSAIASAWLAAYFMLTSCMKS